MSERDPRPNRFSIQYKMIEIAVKTGIVLCTILPDACYRFSSSTSFGKMRFTNSNTNKMKSLWSREVLVGSLKFCLLRDCLTFQLVFWDERSRRRPLETTSYKIARWRFRSVREREREQEKGQHDGWCWSFYFTTIINLFKAEA